MKTCPFCAEEIQDAAIKCRYCQSFLQGTARPPAAEIETSSEDGLGEEALSEELAKPEQSAPEIATTPNSPATEVATVESSSDAVAPPFFVGSPPWRAYIQEYFYILVVGVLAPVIFYLLASAFGASLTTRIVMILIPVAMSAGCFFAMGIYRRSIIYRMTVRTIEHQHGIIHKKVDIIELGRCKDLRFHQGFMDRLLKIAHISVFTERGGEPALTMRGLELSRSVFESIREHVRAAKK